MRPRHANKCIGKMRMEFGMRPRQVDEKHEYRRNRAVMVKPRQVEKNIRQYGRDWDNLIIYIC